MKIHILFFTFLAHLCNAVGTKPVFLLVPAEKVTEALIAQSSNSLAPLPQPNQTITCNLYCNMPQACSNTITGCTKSVMAALTALFSQKSSDPLIATIGNNTITPGSGHAPKWPPTNSEFSSDSGIEISE